MLRLPDGSVGYPLLWCGAGGKSCDPSSDPDPKGSFRVLQGCDRGSGNVCSTPWHLRAVAVPTQLEAPCVVWPGLGPHPKSGHAPAGLACEPKEGSHESCS